ncbi:MAG: hypothetical protein AAFX78_18910, partial [Cyanobacteria bacterium J06638_20]
PGGYWFFGSPEVNSGQCLFIDPVFAEWPVFSGTVSFPCLMIDFSLMFNLTVGLAIVVGYWAVTVRRAGEADDSSEGEH